MRKSLYGRTSLQPMFEKLLTVAMGGMNLGNMDLRDNGELWLLRQVGSLSPGAVIFDVGANIGEYAKAAREAAGAGASIHCFEPSSEAFRELTRQVGSDSGVTLNQVGLSSIEGAVGVLHCNTLGGTGSSLVSKELPDGQYLYPLTEEVRLKTLDAYAAERGISRISLLKIDVEGLELEVLRGAARTLKSGAIERIQFEFGEGSVTAKTHFKDFYEMLAPDYMLFRLLRAGLRPIHRYSLTLELFVTANYVAVRRDLAH
jgi:FkbM family methyltransferase